jgi:hypothetical protein
LKRLKEKKKTGQGERAAEKDKEKVQKRRAKEKTKKQLARLLAKFRAIQFKSKRFDPRRRKKKNSVARAKCL